MASDGKVRNKALADALAGVFASLISLWVFYPVEVWKINVQAATAAFAWSKHHKSKTPLESWIHWISYHFAGIRAKTMHATTSSFCYFFLYSWIVSKYQRRQRSSSAISPSSRLILSAVAALLNTCLTLPFDVISTKHQTSFSDYDNKEPDSATALHETSSDDDDDDDEEYHDASSISRKDDNTDIGHAENKWTKMSQEPSSQRQKRLDPQLVEQVRGLWKGLAPSLILCTNPAINITVFDSIKVRFLRNGEKHRQQLSMTEAFLLGLVAKFVSTVATYPLIQAKVKLMVSDRDCSLLECLLFEYRRHGIKGLYRGCNLQLLHTMLKSALLMMLRERITRTTRRLMLPTNTSNAGDTIG